MGVAKRDIEFVRGDDYGHTIQFQDEACVPFSIVGNTYRSQIRKVFSQVDPSAEFATSTVNAANGELVLTLDHTITKTLLSGDYWWDLEEIDAGVITTLIGGRCRVLADVTR